MIQAGSMTARDRLILDHLHMVKIIALKISSRLPPHIELDDLIHSGVIGLIDAASKFNDQKGIKFATYASLRIKGAILDDLRQMDWATRTQRQKIKDLEKVSLDLNHRLGRNASEDELASEMEMSVQELLKILEQSNGIAVGVFSYKNQLAGQIADEQTLFFSSGDNASDPGFPLVEEEMKELLTKLIDELSEREKMVLSLYYQDDLNLKEIGGVMDLTESRISQIRSLALLRIRARLEEIARQDGVSAKDLFGEL